MAYIIAISNQKGGVGKTTTAISLAGALISENKKVLVIDMDPQGNCSKGLGIDSTIINHSLYNVLTSSYDIKKVIKKTNFKNLDLLPSNANLAIVESKIQDNSMCALKQELVKVEGIYDFILIDTPPSFGYLSISSLIACDYVLIPVQCEYFALDAVSHMLATISNIQTSYNKNIKILGFLLTMYDPRLRLSTSITTEIRKLFKEKTFITQIPRNSTIVESQIAGLPINIYKPNSIGATAYISLTKEVLNELEINACKN